MNAVISVIGRDRVGIIARLSGICAENNVNINDITQKVLHDTFTMILQRWPASWSRRVLRWA